MNRVQFTAMIFHPINGSPGGGGKRHAAEQGFHLLESILVSQWIIIHCLNLNQMRGAKFDPSIGEISHFVLNTLRCGRDDAHPQMPKSRNEMDQQRREERVEGATHRHTHSKRGRETSSWERKRPKAREVRFVNAATFVCVVQPSFPPLHMLEKRIVNV